MCKVVGKEKTCIQVLVFVFGGGGSSSDGGDRTTLNRSTFDVMVGSSSRNSAMVWHGVRPPGKWFLCTCQCYSECGWEQY